MPPETDQPSGNRGHNRLGTSFCAESWLLTLPNLKLLEPPSTPPTFGKPPGPLIDPLVDLLKGLS